MCHQNSLRCNSSRTALRSLLAFALIFCAPPTPLAATTAKLSGTIFTLGNDGSQTVWPNARVSLRNLVTGREIDTVSSELGAYVFNGVPTGAYEVRVMLSGFEPIAKSITL